MRSFSLVGWGSSFFFSIALICLALPFAEAADEGETDSLEAPRESKFGEKTGAWIEEKGDVEFFGFVVERAGIIDWSIEGWKYQHGPYFELFRDGQKVASNLTSYRAEPGNYVLSVSVSQYSWQLGAMSEAFVITLGFYGDFDGTELNDTLESARSISFGERIELALDPRFDVDFVRMEVSEFGVIGWTADGWNQAFGKAPYVVFYDAEGNQIRSGQRDVRVSEGVVYARIRSSQYDWEVKRVKERFGMTFDFAKETDASEPNETIETAAELAIGEMRELRLVPRFDGDMFAIDSPGDGTLRWSVDGYTGNHGPHVMFYDAEGNLLRQGERDLAVKEGRYFAYIKSSQYEWQEASIWKPFKFGMTFEERTDINEPNNEIATATRLDLGDWKTMNFMPRGDVDVFALSVSEYGVLNFEKRGWEEAERASPHLRWFDEAGTLLQDGGKGFRVEPGDYFVSMISHPYSWNEAVVRELFDIRFVMDSTLASSEPNNDFDEATVVELGQAIGMNFTPQRDVDYYKIDLSAAGVLRWSFEGWEADAAGSGMPYSWFYDVDGALISDGYDQEAYAAGEGSYYLAMRAAEFPWQERVVAKPFETSFAFYPGETLPIDEVEEAGEGGFAEDEAGASKRLGAVQRWNFKIIRKKDE